MPAILYPRFVNQIANLETVAGLIAAGNQGTGQRLWRVPQAWAGDPSDPAAMIPPFDRADLNEAYANFFSDGSKTGDVLATKLQAEHLGSQERAFRLRHSGAIRCSMHAANRRNGHAMASGIFGRVADHVQDLIIADNTGG